MIVIQSVSEWEMERVTDWDEMKGRGRERESESANATRLRSAAPSSFYRSSKIFRNIELRL